MVRWLFRLLRLLVVLALVGAGAAGGWFAHDAYGGRAEEWMAERNLEVRVESVERMGTHLQLRLRSQDEVFLATFTERVDDLDRLVAEGATLRLRVRVEGPLTDDPEILEVRLPDGVVSTGLEGLSGNPLYPRLPPRERSPLEEEAPEAEAAPAPSDEPVSILTAPEERPVVDVESSPRNDV
jgi:hypothetical protein